MTLPYSRNRTYIDGVTQIPAGDMNDIQDFIISRSSTCFGDGSDGNITLDGAVAAPSWASKSGAIYTAMRDVFCNNLTLTGATTELKMAGYRLFVLVRLTTSGGAVVHADGLPGSTGTGGAAGSTGTMLSGFAGGAGGFDATNGAAGTSATSSFGGAGGAGGNGSGSGSVLGAGGTVTNPTAGLGNPRALSAATLGYVFGQSAGTPTTTAIKGGAGGGGGGNGGGNPGTGGGGGGGGGGVLSICAWELDLAAAANIRTKGGAGANGYGTAGGGGGGGGGGVVYLVYAKNIAGSAFSSATNCPGGAGGTALGGGPVAGSTGSAGTLIKIVI